MKINYQKISGIIGKILFVFIFGSIGALWANYYLLPKLSAFPLFSQSDILKRFRENVTVINKTEQLTITEESSISKIASQASTTTVNIISIPEAGVNKFQTAPLSNRIGGGVIVTGDGLIITYREAILEKNAQYKVVINNGNSFDAKLLAVDEFSNLAFLKVDGSNLSSISLANSDDFSAGKRIIALGKGISDFQNKYFSGILSNINKNFNISGETLSNSGKLEGVFETDFLNQKDLVGSPIIDYNGELVGIIGSIKIDNQDKFFIIPSNQVRRLIEKQIQGNLKNSVNLGVYYVSLSKLYALSHNLKQDRGAFIFSSSGKQGLAVIANSPAEKADLRINDIITAVEDKAVNLDHPLSNLMNEYKFGDEVSLTILRDGQEIKLPVQL
ncbi:MAG: hypothetical protein C0412_17335 [Flavobacterium sp.]|nr:hypothetical protein [Flavobacterium sp.]